MKHWGLLLLCCILTGCYPNFNQFKGPDHCKSVFDAHNGAADYDHYRIVDCKRGGCGSNNCAGQ